MYPYESDEGLFYLKFMGHGPCSVYSFMKKLELDGWQVKGDIEKQLLIPDFVSLDALDICGMIILCKEPQRFCIKLKEFPTIPDQKKLLQMLATMFEHKCLKDLPELEDLFGKVELVADWQIGTQPVHKASVCKLGRKSIVLLNGTTQLRGDGSLCALNKDVDKVLFEVVLGEKPKVQEVQPIAGKVVVMKHQAKTWQEMSPSQWTLAQLMGWVRYYYQESLGQPVPFNHVELLQTRFGTAVKTLAGMVRAENHAKTIEAYTKYVAWLVGHDFYSLTSVALCSTKTMEQYVAGLHKPQKKKTKTLDGMRRS